MKRKIIAWDTTVFLAWLNEEEDKGLDDIELVIREDIETEKVTLVVPIVAYTEVLVFTEGDLAKTFREYFSRPNVVLASLTRPIADRTAQIRAESIRANAKAKKNKPPKLKIADAFIVATSLELGASILHSYDPDLLNLSHHATIGGLRVEHPSASSGHRALKPTDG
jgi:predicted nucleic acid-binding protein